MYCMFNWYYPCNYFMNKAIGRQSDNGLVISILIVVGIAINLKCHFIHFHICIFFNQVFPLKKKCLFTFPGRWVSTNFNSSAVMQPEYFFFGNLKKKIRHHRGFKMFLFFFRLSRLDFSLNQHF